MIGQKFQVELTADCIAHGGGGEYPNGQIGTETIPARIVAQTRDDTGVVNMYEAAHLYQQSGPVSHERLRHLNFGHRELWVPEWVLRLVPETTTAAN